MSTVLTSAGVQVLFLSGITLIIGPHKTFYFFARKNKLRGTICFLGGIIIVIVLKRPFIGILVEAFGFLNLFGCAALTFTFALDTNSRSSRDFFPVIITFLRQLPFVGHFLTLPYISTVRYVLCLVIP